MCLFVPVQMVMEKHIHLNQCLGVRHHIHGRTFSRSFICKHKTWIIEHMTHLDHSPHSQTTSHFQTQLHHRHHSPDCYDGCGDGWDVSPSAVAVAEAGCSHLEADCSLLHVVVDSHAASHSTGRRTVLGSVVVHCDDVVVLVSAVVVHRSRLDCRGSYWVDQPSCCAGPAVVAARNHFLRCAEGTGCVAVVDMVVVGSRTVCSQRDPDQCQLYVQTGQQTLRLTNTVLKMPPNPPEV